MKPHNETVIFAVLTTAITVSTLAATTKTVRFNSSDAGVSKPIHKWGIDATWVSWNNTQDSVRNAGSEIDFVRVGFYLHEPCNDDGSLSPDQISKLENALNCASIVAPDIPIMISPHNEQGIIDWYRNSDGGVRLDRWYHVMEKSREYIEAHGHKVVYVEVFEIQAKPPQGDRSKWMKIIPGHPR